MVMLKRMRREGCDEDGDGDGEDEEDEEDRLCDTDPEFQWIPSH